MECEIPVFQKMLPPLPILNFQMDKERVGSSYASGVSPVKIVQLVLGANDVRSCSVSCCAFTNSAPPSVEFCPNVLIAFVDIWLKWELALVMSQHLSENTASF